jgi:hypothetical protein
MGPARDQHKDWAVTQVMGLYMSSVPAPTGHVGTRRESKWDTIWPRWDTKRDAILPRWDTVLP